MSGETYTITISERQRLVLSFSTRMFMDEAYHRARIYASPEDPRFDMEKSKKFLTDAQDAEKLLKLLREITE